MLKTFVECEVVKAVVSVGCCYNLLSKEGFNHVGTHRGFPMSGGVKSTDLSLGKSSRDLACQSAERWSCLENDLLHLCTPNPHTLPCLKQERENGVRRRSESTHRKALISSVPFKFPDGGEQFCFEKS